MNYLYQGHCFDVQNLQICRQGSDKAVKCLALAFHVFLLQLFCLEKLEKCWKKFPSTFTEQNMDYSKVCRSCMKQVEESENSETNILDMFTFCTRLKIKDDCTLPKVFCKYCTKAIKCSYSYIRKARWIDDKLKTLIPNTVNVVVNPEKCKRSGKDIKDSVTNEESELEFSYAEEANIIVEALNIEHDSKEKNERKKENKNYIPKKSTKLKKNTTVCKRFRERRAVNKLEDFDSEEEVNVTDLYVTHSFEDDLDDTSNNLNDTDDTSNIKAEEIKIDVKTKEKSKGKNKAPVRKSYRVRLPMVEPKEKPIIEYLCKICSKKFDKQLWLLRHIPKFHPEIENIEANMIIKVDTTEVVEEKVTLNSKGKTVLDCPLCKREFVSKLAYQKHIKNKKDGVDRKTCKICQKVFKSACHLSTHNYKIHLKKFKCNICGKKYRSKDNCVQHQETHEEVDPITCAECSKQFKTVYDYTMHLNTHKNQKPPILCHLCGRKFDLNRSLKIHMFTHTKEQPLRCTVCPYRTAYASAMRVHKLRHDGIRKKLCTLCPKKFIDAAALERHMRCHTGERPFRCPYCDVGFIDSWKRKSHIMHKHSLAFDEIPRMDRHGNVKRDS